MFSNINFLMGTSQAPTSGFETLPENIISNFTII